MVQTLPTSPAPREAHARLVTSRNELRSATGTNAQRIGRKGDHYAYDVTMPPMTYAQSLEWIGLRTAVDQVVMPVRQPGLDTGSPGTPLVNGAGQAGTTLIMDGFTPGYMFRKGQYLTHVHVGRRRLYSAAAEATADGSGNLTLILETMLLYPPNDNDQVLVAQPEIEGFASFDDSLWTVDVARTVGLAFTIEELGS